MDIQKIRKSKKTTYLSPKQFQMAFRFAPYHTGIIPDRQRRGQRFNPPTHTSGSIQNSIHRNNPTAKFKAKIKIKIPLKLKIEKFEVMSV